MGAKQRRGSIDSEMARFGSRTAGVASSVLLSKIITLVLAGISFIIVSRILGPANYGLYVLAASIAGTLGAMGGLGISATFPKFIAERSSGKRDEMGELVTSGVLLVLLAGVILAALAVLLSGPIARYVFGSASYSYLVVLAALMVVATLMLDLSYSILLGLGRRLALVTITAIQVGVQAAVSIGLALLGFGAVAPIAGATMGFAVGAIANLASTYRRERLSFAIPGRAALKGLLLFSLPIGVFSTVSGAVTNLSNIVLGIFSTSAIVGNVGVALRTGGIITIAVDSVGLALLPLFASVQAHRKGRSYTSRFYNYSVYLMFVLLAPVVLFIAILSPNISVILFTGSYAAAPLYISIVALGLLLTVVSNYTYTLLVSRNKVVEIMKYGLAVSAVQMILVLLLVPIFKGLALIAVGSIAAPSMLLAAYLWKANGALGIRLGWRRILGVLAVAMISALFMIPLVLLFSKSSFIIIVLAAMEQLAIYPVLLSYSGAVNAKDLAIIKRLSSGIPMVGWLVGALSDYALRFSRQ